MGNIEATETSSQDRNLQRTVERTQIMEKNFEVAKTVLMSGFLNGVKLSKCPKFHAATVSRWSKNIPQE